MSKTTMRKIAVPVPAGMQGGMELILESLKVTIPQGLRAGQDFYVLVPVAAPPRMAPSASSDRIAERLQRLPPNVLISLVAEACAASPRMCAAVDKATAEYDPVPHWAVTSVLTSADLLVPIMEHLKIRHGAVASVCKAWEQAWQATSERRCRLRHLSSFPIPDEYGLLPASKDQLTVLSEPGVPKTFFAYSFHEHEVKVLNDEMSCLRSFRVGGTINRMAATPAGVYLAGHSDSIPPQDTEAELRLLDGATGEQLARWTDPATDRVSGMAFGPDDTLYALCFGGDHGAYWSKVVALDASTLEKRFEFFVGGGRTSGALAVGNGAVYVSEPYIHSTSPLGAIRVFTLTGEPLRVLQGEWQQLRDLCFFRDHLFFSRGEAIWPYQEGRIKVVMLDLQGEEVHAYEDDEWRARREESENGIVSFAGMMVSGSELLVHVISGDAESDQAESDQAFMTVLTTGPAAVVALSRDNTANG